MALLAYYNIKPCVISWCGPNWKVLSDVFFPLYKRIGLSSFISLEGNNQHFGVQGHH